MFQRPRHISGFLTNRKHVYHRSGQNFSCSQRSRYCGSVCYPFARQCNLLLNHSIANSFLKNFQSLQDRNTIGKQRSKRAGKICKNTTGNNTLNKRRFQQKPMPPQSALCCFNSPNSKNNQNNQPDKNKQTIPGRKTAEIDQHLSWQR